MSQRQHLRWWAVATVALILLGVPAVASAQGNKPKDKGSSSPGQPPAVQSTPIPLMPFFPTTGKGSRPKGNNGVGNGIDPPPPGNPPVNDGIGTGPGQPGNRGGAAKGKGKKR
jgi:hypothetical protein